LKKIEFFFCLLFNENKKEKEDKTKTQEWNISIFNRKTKTEQPIMSSFSLTGYLLVVVFIFLFLGSVFCLNKAYVYHQHQIIESEFIRWKNVTKVYYINLAHRKDRAQQFSEEIPKFGFKKTANVEKFDASYNTVKGFMGCTLSHLRVLEDARKHNYRFVLVFEDDFMVKRKNLEELFDKAWETFPTCNVLMLASNAVKTSKTKVKGLNKVKQALTTSGYAVRRSYFGVMIENLRQSYLLERPCDVGFCFLQRRDLWLAFVPGFGVQRPSYSDIEKKKVDYGFLENAT
jgi:glycosyl transferase family 25